MDLTYTPEEEAFRAKVATWIKDHAPRREQRSDLQAMREWQRHLHKAGFLHTLLAVGAAVVTSGATPRPARGCCRQRK